MNIFSYFLTLCHSFLSISCFTLLNFFCKQKLEDIFSFYFKILEVRREGKFIILYQLWV